MNQKSVTRSPSDRAEASFSQRRLANANTPVAVVIGGSYRALAVVRSLGRQGIPVWVLTDEHRLAAYSRFACRSLQWPETDPASQVRFLEELAENDGLEGSVIFPTDDATAAFVSRHHERLSERFKLTVPPWDRFEWSYNKLLTYQLAADLAIPCPWTVSPGRVDKLAAKQYPFPMVLKPAIKPTQNDFTHDKAWRVENVDELSRRFEEASHLIDPSLILFQELIPNAFDGQFSYATFCDHGRPLASIVACRVRQYPLEFGRASTYVESVDLPEIEEVSWRLLAATQFSGLVEVEFKRDPRDGQLKLLDANPRVWGWHSLGRRANVDFPYLYWKFLQDGEIPETTARRGVRWVRGTFDVMSAAALIRIGTLSLAAYVQSLYGGVEYAVLAADDPMPAIVDLPLLAAISVRRRWRKSLLWMHVHHAGKGGQA